MSRIITSAIAALAVAAIVAPAALAEGAPVQSSMRVAYGDLDMTTSVGGKALLRRIEVAARRACDDVTTRSPQKPRAIATCSRETVATTVRGLDIGALTLAWSGKNTATRLAAR